VNQVKTSNGTEARSWPGLDVFDREGDRIGRLIEIYGDRDEAVFGLVRTGLFGLRSVVVPLTGAFEEGSVLIVALDRRGVKGAPHLRRDEPLNDELEDELYAHYGLERDPGRRLELWEPEPAGSR
jgi:hypothetical protein